MSSLELNCYCTSGLCMYKTSTGSRTTSATNAAKYPTYKQTSQKYQYTAPLNAFVVLHQRMQKRQDSKPEGSQMDTHNPVGPISHANRCIINQAIEHTRKLETKQEQSDDS